LPHERGNSFFLDKKRRGNYLVYKRFAMVHYSDCIVFLLAKAYQKAHGSLKRRLAEFGLTPIQVLVIEALRDEEGVSAGELGKKLVLDSATLSGVLERLAEKGWIVKETDEVDRRSLRVYLGHLAKRLNDPLGEQRQMANDDIMENLSTEERVLLKRLLKDLNG
jgi:DNA-binding MarR family transcriptional regulator